MAQCSKTGLDQSKHLHPAPWHLPVMQAWQRSQATSTCREIWSILSTTVVIASNTVIRHPS